MAPLTQFETDKFKLYDETIAIDFIEIQYQRTVMNIWDVIGNVGGITSVLYLVATFFMTKYSNLGFKIEAINELFTVKKTNTNIQITQITFF